MKRKAETVLCCDGPNNGEYIKVPSQTIGLTISSADHWVKGKYELVEWPNTGEIVAFWRDNAGH